MNVIVAWVVIALNEFSETYGTRFRKVLIAQWLVVSLKVVVCGEDYIIALKQYSNRGVLTILLVIRIT